MLDTSLRKKRAAGFVILAVLLALFLAFNRLPKLDTVRGDLEVVSAVEVECFQGFCIEDEPDSTLLERWWDFSTTYMRLVAAGDGIRFPGGRTHRGLPCSRGPAAWATPGAARSREGSRDLSLGRYGTCARPVSFPYRPPLPGEALVLRARWLSPRGLPLSISPPWRWRCLSSLRWWEAVE